MIRYLAAWHSLTLYMEWKHCSSLIGQRESSPVWWTPLFCLLGCDKGILPVFWLFVNHYDNRLTILPTLWGYYVQWKTIPGGESSQIQPYLAVKIKLLVATDYILSEDFSSFLTITSVLSKVSVTCCMLVANWWKYLACVSQPTGECHRWDWDLWRCKCKWGCDQLWCAYSRDATVLLMSLPMWEILNNSSGNGCVVLRML